MAVQFPSSPTDGQYYPVVNPEFIYNATKTRWDSLPLQGAKTITADSAPAGAKDGDQWLNTVTNILYIWVVDTDGGQWIESQAPITANGYYSPNYIINGGFDIWQRGTGPFTGAAFSADRYYMVSNTGTLSVSRSTDVPAGIGVKYSLSMGVTSGTYPQMLQRIESINAARFAGKTVTLSVYAKNTAGTSPLHYRLMIPQGDDDWAGQTNDAEGVFSSSPAGTWTRYSVTFTVSALATRGYGILIWRNSTTAETSTTLLTGLQLEEGSVATPFRRNANSIQGELAACQRYFVGYRPAIYTNIYGGGSSESTTTASFSLQLPVTMRIPPSSISYSSVSDWGAHLPNAVLNAASTLVLSSATAQTANLYMTHAANGAYGGYKSVYLASMGNSNPFLGINAEL